MPDTVNFNVGYFDGRQQAQLWLVTNEDLESMYSKYHTGEINHSGAMADLTETEVEKYAQNKSRIQKQVYPDIKKGSRR